MAARTLRFSRLQVDIRELLALTVAIISILIAGLTAYNSNDKAIEHRLTVVETQRIQDHETIQRIEAKLDALSVYLGASLPSRK